MTALLSKLRAVFGVPWDREGMVEVARYNRALAYARAKLNPAYTPPKDWAFGKEAWGKLLRVKVSQRRLDRALREHRRLMKRQRERAAR